MLFQMTNFILILIISPLFSGCMGETKNGGSDNYYRAASPSTSFFPLFTFKGTGKERKIYFVSRLNLKLCEGSNWYQGAEADFMVSCSISQNAPTRATYLATVSFGEKMAVKVLRLSPVTEEAILNPTEAQIVDSSDYEQIPYAEALKTARNYFSEKDWPTEDAVCKGAFQVSCADLLKRP